MAAQFPNALTWWGMSSSKPNSRMPCKVISSMTARFHPLTYPAEKGGKNWRPGTSSNAYTSQLLDSHHVRVRQEPFRQDKLQELDCVVWFDHAWHAQVAPKTAIARGWTNQRHLMLDAGFSCDPVRQLPRFGEHVSKISPPQKILAAPPSESSKIFSQNFCEKIPPGGVWFFLAHDFLHPATCGRFLKNFPATFCTSKEAARIPAVDEVFSKKIWTSQNY